MTKTMNHGQRMKQAQAKRAYAIQRDELRGPSVPRESAAGPVSMGVKAVAPEVRAMIDAAVAAKRGRS